MIADADALRSHLGTVSNIDNTALQRSLDSAISWVVEHVMAHVFQDPDTQLAILLLASRLYKRRQTPEGSSGWQDTAILTMLARDPDVDLLLEHKYNYCNVGLA